MANNKTNWDDKAFKKRIYEIYDNIEVIGSYQKTSQPVMVKCTVCGNIWEPIANNLLRGITHCPVCSKKKRVLKLRISQKDFERKVQEKNPEIEILSSYITNKDRVKCRCLKCGNEWNPVAGSLLQGYGCQKCARKLVGSKKKTSHSDFIEKLSKIRPEVEVLGQYDGAYKPIKCRCKICNHIWMAVPHNMLTRSGCPNCSHSATSFIEQFILFSFQKILGKDNVVTRNKKAIGKELDIYIPSMKVAIEPGGWVFHKKRLKKDLEKRKSCEQNGIRLITIYYACDDVFELSEDLLVYKSNFQTENEFKDLKELVLLLLNKLDIQCSFVDEDWLQIKNEAYLNSRKTTTEEFISRLNMINPNITVLGEYKSSSERVKCKCKICGHIWNPQANCLLQGRGCPKCKNILNGNRLRYTQEEFLAKIKNSNILPLEDYIDSKTKIRFRCLKCNYEWPTTPEVLFSGHGCPNCAGRPKITTESFKKRMMSINPNIEIIGEYVNTGTKIKYRCKICGYEGSATPNYLQNGNKCLNCMGRRNINTEIFKERMLRVNPNIEIRGEYKNTSTKVLCFCKVCGLEWLGTPRDLQTGHGCPECGRKRKGKRKSIKKED